MTTTKSQSEGFSGFAKFLIVLTAVGVLGAGYYAFQTFGDTQIGITLQTQTATQNGLVAHWTMDGPHIDLASSTAEMRDASGNADHGDWVSHASTTVLGRIGQAIEFDGTDDHVIRQNDFPKNEGTIAAWLKPDQIRFMMAVYESSCNNSNCDGGGSGSSVVEIELGVDDAPDTWWFQYQDGNGSDGTRYRIFGEGPDAIAGEWAHVVATWNYTGDMELYVNGERASSTDISGQSFAGLTSQYRFLGRVGDHTSSRSWDGDMDDIRIYDEQLSAEAVKRLYQLGATSKIQKTANSIRGLVAHYTFDDVDIDTNETNAEIRDKSGKGNHGDLEAHSGATVPGVIGEALDFNGTDEWIDAGGEPIYQLNEVTFAAWVNVDSSHSGNGQPVAYYKNGNNGWDLRYNNGAGGIMIHDDLDGGDENHYATSISTDAWYHYALMLEDNGDGTWSNIFYINGELVGTSSASDTSLATTTTTVGDVTIGARHPSLGSSFALDGIIDDVRIYNQAITAEDVQLLYALGSSTAETKNTVNQTLPVQPSLKDSLVAHYTFDGPDIDLSLDTAEVRDTSGNANHGNWFNHASTTRAGRIGQGIDFDGTDDYVDVGSIGTIRTISFWIKTDDTTSREIINVDGTDHIEITAGSVISAVSFPSNTVYVDGAIDATVITKEWHHVVVVVNSGSVSGSTFQIGRVGSGYFDGKVDNVQVFDRALTANEVIDLYEQGE